MTLSQAVTLLETVESGAHWRAAYVVLSLLPGVRTEETRAITWDEVDLTAGMVAVYRSVRGQGRHQDPQEPARPEAAHQGGAGAPRLSHPPGRGTARSGGDVAGTRSVFCREDGTPLDRWHVRTGRRWIAGT
jgi:integrase